MLGDQALSQVSRDEIERHLAQCSSCHAVYFWLKEYYEDFNATAREEERERVAGYLDELWNETPGHPGLIPLQQLDYPEEEQAEDEERSMVVLAAKSKKSPEHRYVQVVALGSSKDQVLARILYDRHEKQYQLYLLSGRDDASVQHAILSLPEWNLELVADQKGKLKFGRSEELLNADWAETQAYLRLPAYVLSGKPNDLEGRHEVDDVLVDYLDLSVLERDLRVTLSPRESNSTWTRLLLETEGGKRELVKLEDQFVDLADINPSHNLTLRFYP